MPVIVIMDSGSEPPAELPQALTLDQQVTWRVTGFLELSQIVRWTVPQTELILDQYVTWRVPATVPAPTVGVLEASGGAGQQSWSYSQSRGSDTRADVTLMGDHRGGGAGALTASVGGYSASYGGGLPAIPEHEYERRAERDSAGAVVVSETTTLHLSGALNRPAVKLPELVPWEDKTPHDLSGVIVSALPGNVTAAQVESVPAGQRQMAARDGRWMDINQLLMAALSYVPHRLLAPLPWAGYRLRADGGPSTSTLGKDPADVASEFLGPLGYPVGYEDGVLVIRSGLPAGDAPLPVPLSSYREERVTLDAAESIETEGGTPGSEADPNDPYNPDDPANSPDPDEREKDPAPWERGVSPTPEVVAVGQTSVTLKWAAVPNAFQYVLEYVQGEESPDLNIWGRAYLGYDLTATHTGLEPNTLYTYRLRVNAGGTNTVLEPSPAVGVMTAAEPVKAPKPPTGLAGVSVGTTEFTMRWAAPTADADHDEADFYRVLIYAHPHAGGESALYSVSPVYPLSLRVSGLQVGRAYDVEVIAVNASGESIPAPASVQLVNLPPATPRGLQNDAAEGGNSAGEGGTLTPPHIIPSWEQSDGAESYAVQTALAEPGTPERLLAWTTSGPPIPPPKPVPGDTSTPRVRATFTLLPGHRYAVRVRASNAVGASDWTAPLYVTLPDLTTATERDPEADSFEQNPDGTISTYRETQDSREENTIWKRGGNVVATRREVSSFGPVALDEGTGGLRIRSKPQWFKASTTTVKNLYEIPLWPQTLTGSVTETVNYSRQPGLLGTEESREQEKVHQEWSPQGWLNRRTTWRQKPVALALVTGEDGAVTGSVASYSQETIFETWTPVGGGLWHYQRQGTQTILVPAGEVDQDALAAGGFDLTYDAERLSAITRAIPGEDSVSESAPPQATMPKDEPGKDPPPLERNKSPKGLDGYKPGDKWFTTPDTGGGGGPQSPPDAPPGDPPRGPGDPPASPPPNGSNNPTGEPAPDEPQKPNPNTPATLTRGTGQGNGSGVTLSQKLPWVTDRVALAKFQAMLAATRGPRLRITRTTFLPCSAPSNDAAVSVSASFQAGGPGEPPTFTMTVTSEVADG